jgi:hypothetical protein
MERLKPTGIDKKTYQDKIKEGKRKGNIVNNVMEEYSLTDEIALMNKTIEALIEGKKVPKEYLDYRKRVKDIKKNG